MAQTRPTLFVWLACTAALAGLGRDAHAQLRDEQVLVVYDSRIPDSKAIAEFYVGSAKVPAGAGGQPGVHPRVNVLDISTRTIMGGGSLAGVSPFSADISYATFKTQLRDPLRAYLAQTGQAYRIRCIVLTKGMPHRIENISATPPLNPTIGDNPAQLNAAFDQGQGGNLTYCSVDSELTLLQQSLDLGQAGVPADSWVDGMICNPYWRATTTINGFSTRNIYSAKLFDFPGDGNDGIYWLNETDPAAPTTLTPGDIYLVCRLDGNAVADVIGMVNRARNLVLPMDAARLLFDSDGNNIDGTGDPAALDFGPDYAISQALLASDGRFPLAHITSDFAPGFTGFHVGPNISYVAAANGPPIIDSAPLLLLASFGSNHSGVNGNGTNAGTTYANSFNYLPGAVFNTIESYNGRSYGGIGGNPFVPQQQSADALAGLGGAGGCTFALANVWEPFALSVADNDQIIANFFLGNMTWAEAAYSALPALSWQQIVIGDPLARPRRDREDINADGKVTIDDLYAWQQTPVDLNNSGMADDADFRLLEASVRVFELAGMKGEQR